MSCNELPNYCDRNKCIVISCNALYINHESWFIGQSSPVLLAYSGNGIKDNIPSRQTTNIVPTKENDRIKDLVIKCNELLNTSEQIIICLQEVSGDLFMELKEIQNVEIDACCHLREPKAEHWQHQYSDPKEYLVIIAKNFKGKLLSVDNIRFNDEGKAVQVVQIDNLVTMNCHLPWGNNQISQEVIDKVFKKITTYPNPNIVFCGDTNRNLDTMIQEIKLGGIDRYSFHDHSEVTFPQGDKSIDHIVAFSNTKIGPYIYQNPGPITDHIIVRAEIILV